MPLPSEVTQLLINWREGDEEALDRLMPLVYTQLQQLAHARLRDEEADHTLNATALVHEVYLRLVQTEQVQVEGRVHFLVMASRLMRHILVDYGRKKRAAKRGGGQQKVALNEEILGAPELSAEAVLDLDDALTRLAQIDPRQSQILEHRYFGGLTADESALALGVSRATIQREMRKARAWLSLQWL